MLHVVERASPGTRADGWHGERSGLRVDQAEALPARGMGRGVRVARQDKRRRFRIRIAEGPIVDDAVDLNRVLDPECPHTLLELGKIITPSDDSPACLGQLCQDAREGLDDGEVALVPARRADAGHRQEARRSIGRRRHQRLRGGRGGQAGHREGDDVDVALGYPRVVGEPGPRVAGGHKDPSAPVQHPAPDPRHRPPDLGSVSPYGERGVSDPGGGQGDRRQPDVETDHVLETIADSAGEHLTRVRRLSERINPAPRCRLGGQIEPDHRPVPSLDDTLRHSLDPAPETTRRREDERCWAGAHAVLLDAGQARSRATTGAVTDGQSTAARTA